MRKVGVSPESERGSESPPDVEFGTTSQLRYKRGDKKIKENQRKCDGVQGLKGKSTCILLIRNWKVRRTLRI